MTAIIEDTDIDWMTILDFESDMACEGKDECDKPVEWKMTNTCCNASFLICTPCKVDFDEWLEAAKDVEIECTPCGFQAIGKNFPQVAFRV